jgi:hypothetical protein
MGVLAATWALQGSLFGAGVVGRPEGELRDHLWVAWGVARSILAGRLPLRADWAGVPDGVPLYPLDPLHQLVLTALTPAVGTVGALDTLAFLLFVLLVVAAQSVAGRFGAGVVGELGVAALAATAPPFLGPFADTQTEGMAAGWLLLLVGEVLAPQPRAVRAGAYAALLVWSAPYPAHAVAAAVGVLWLARRLSWRAALLPLAAAAVAGGLLYATERQPGGALAARQAHLAAATTPPRASPIGVAPPPPLPDDGVVRRLAPYPGAAETGPRREAAWALLAAVGLAFVWRPARVPAALACAFAAVALGNRLGGNGEAVDFPTPYTLFWRYYPLARYAWKPAQAAVPAMAFAVVAVAAAWGAAGVRGRAVLGALVSVAVIEHTMRSSTPLPLPASALYPRPAWVALPSGGGAVAEYPCRDRGVPSRPPVADVLLGPLWHGRALGETPNRGPTPAHAALLGALEAAAAGRGEAASLRAALDGARSAGFDTVLILGAQLPPDAAPRLAAALAAAGATVSGPDAEGSFVGQL